MKGAFFQRPLEWSIETPDESWEQGGKVRGTLRVKNQGPENVPLKSAGAGLAYADIKKVHAKTSGILKHGKTFCTYLLLRRYLLDSIVFSRYTDVPEIFEGKLLSPMKTETPVASPVIIPTTPPADTN